MHNGETNGGWTGLKKAGRDKTACRDTDGWFSLVKASHREILNLIESTLIYSSKEVDNIYIYETKRCPLFLFFLVGVYNFAGFNESCYFLFLFFFKWCITFKTFSTAKALSPFPLHTYFKYLFIHFLNNSRSNTTSLCPE